MKLSVVIVNYNVRAYLEQCLRTVVKALEGMEGEVFVVDNQSSDGSVEMVRGKFPGVRLIANTDNVGFSRANNQAIRLAAGEYVLLLNPDTVVGEDTFARAVAFMDAHPRAGGLGVRMIDGTGRFLPESKRGLPTPAVAFFKIIGLAWLFPRSRVFGRYHLGHLPEHETAPIEILSGACMFLRKKTLDEVGLLDEHFFMYGEDIDLSYRITLGGYQNWYLPQARIIHYKGESTKKSSVNYVFVFYNAMAIFARKHFTRRGTGLFGLLINGSIYLSAAGAIISRFLRRLLLPGLDAAVLAGIAAGTGWWPMWAAPCALAGLWLAGAYDPPFRPITVVRGAAVAMLLVLPVLATGGSGLAGLWLLRWALFGAAVLLGGIALRGLLRSLKIKPFALRGPARRSVVVVGRPEEARATLALLWQTHGGLGREHRVDPAELPPPGQEARLLRRSAPWRADEVVFCPGGLSAARMMDLMEALRHSGAMFKIAQPDQEHIIGPSSIESLQDLFILPDHALTTPTTRRVKRVFDVVLAALLLATAPLMLPWRRGRRAVVLAWSVLRGRRSWVGYHLPMPPGPKLPPLPPGVAVPIPPAAGPPDALVRMRANTYYAKDYSVLVDIIHLWNHVKRPATGAP
ncbi:MAG: glycosyltransferase [Flavobacteriales bacterium]|jgi:GT2 family glycosyltransferase|nr:glycosyltransferase [Flavobacteriales bacterium]